MDSAATRVACAIQLEIRRAHPEYALAREHTTAWADKHFFWKQKTVDDLPLTVFTDARPVSLQKSCVVISSCDLVETVSSDVVDTSKRSISQGATKRTFK